MRISQQLKYLSTALLAIEPHWCSLILAGILSLQPSKYTWFFVKIKLTFWILNILLRKNFFFYLLSVLFAESQTAERSGIEFRETNSVILDLRVILLHSQQVQQLRFQHAMGEPLPNGKPVAYGCTGHLERPPSQRVLHPTRGYLSSCPKQFGKQLFVQHCLQEYQCLTWRCGGVPLP